MRLIAIAPTLRGQVYRHCMRLGWPTGAAMDAAGLAAEIAGSNRPLFGTTLLHVIAEACLVDCEGGAA